MPKTKPNAQPERAAEKPARADAARNLDAVLEAAQVVFATSGVDAPVREIAARAGVGVATLYRHFPQRIDLIVAVFRREVDACVASAAKLSRAHSSLEALTRWLHGYTSLIATKRGLAGALQSAGATHDELASYFQQSVEPVLNRLLEAAVRDGDIVADIDPHALLRAAGSMTPEMVTLLVDGLRYRAFRAQRAGRRRR